LISFFYNNKIEKPARISTTAPELQATYIYICPRPGTKVKLKQKHKAELVSSQRRGEARDYHRAVPKNSQKSELK